MASVTASSRVGMTVLLLISLIAVSANAWQAETRFLGAGQSIRSWAVAKLDQPGMLVLRGGERGGDVMPPLEQLNLAIKHHGEQLAKQSRHVLTLALSKCKVPIEKAYEVTLAVVGAVKNLFSMCKERVKKMLPAQPEKESSKKLPVHSTSELERTICADFVTDTAVQHPHTTRKISVKDRAAQIKSATILPLRKKEEISANDGPMGQEEGTELSASQIQAARLQAEADEAAERLRLEQQAEEQALLEAQQAEEERLALEAKAAEAAQAKKIEEERLAAEAQRIEQERLAAEEEAKRVEEQRLAKEAEAAAKAEAQRAENERLAAEAEARRIEEERIASEAKAAAEAEAQKIEADRQAAALEAQRLKDEQLAAEEKRLKEELAVAEAEAKRLEEEQQIALAAAEEIALAEEEARRRRDAEAKQGSPPVATKLPLRSFSLENMASSAVKAVQSIKAAILPNKVEEAKPKAPVERQDSMPEIELDEETQMEIAPKLQELKTTLAAIAKSQDDLDRQMNQIHSSSNPESSDGEHWTQKTEGGELRNLDEAGRADFKSVELLRYYIEELREKQHQLTEKARQLAAEEGLLSQTGQAV